MADGTALERTQLVVQGDRSELRVADGRITISKQAPTRDAPTSVEFGVEQVRGTQLRAPARGAPGWLHVGVVGGSPAPPGELAAAGDPYTLPVTARSIGSARRFVRLVDRHVQERGMPRDEGPNEGRLSSGVAITTAPPTSETASDVREPASHPPEVSTSPADASDLVAELRALAELHTSGALSDEEFGRAKARLLG